jgi:hypothetical protein
MRYWLAEYPDLVHLHTKFLFVHAGLIPGRTAVAIFVYPC